MHTASPLHYNISSAQDLIGPAVAGTNNILSSALRRGNDTVRRIVFTSSCASVVTPDEIPRVYNETDWNIDSVGLVERKGIDAPMHEIYRASKTLAERAVWDFAEKNKGVSNFDITVLNPSYVFGPVLHKVASPSALNLSMLAWYNVVLKGTLTDEQLTTNGCVNRR